MSIILHPKSREAPISSLGTQFLVQFYNIVTSPLPTKCPQLFPQVTQLMATHVPRGGEGGSATRKLAVKGSPTRLVRQCMHPAFMIRLVL